MIKYSAGYSETNNNFVIQNIDYNIDKKIDKQYLSWICIIKNILQRWLPTKMSEYLQKKLKHENSELSKPLALISNNTPNWQRIIKWNIKNNYIPAKDFFYKIPEYLWKEYKYIQGLICPEVLINDITQVEVKDFEQQQVDFYLPQAFLVIEIDWHNPKDWSHGTDDEKRDIHLTNYGIRVIRIDTYDISSNNDVFKQKINEIKDQINKTSNRIETKYSDQIKLWLKDYKSSYELWINYNDIRAIATATIRFQLLIIELLNQEYLSFSKNWNFDIVLNEELDEMFIEYAIEDLFLWMENIYKLQKISFQKPNYAYNIVDHNKISTNKDTINIDFSVSKRRTDENQVKKDIIYVRTDYFDYYMRFEQEKNKATFKEFIPYNNFKLDTTTPFIYQITEKDKKELKFLLRNIFGYDDFNEWQFPIIQNILSGKDTIWLLPTGWGKSLCFHLACLLQPAISFVVCPIKSLMYDQEQELKWFWINRIACITSDFTAIEKNLIQQKFSREKYFFVFISPERFQTQSFRKYLSELKNIAYAVIDEIHCLSEWWHDFRTSYLCLARTIKNHCKWARFLWLTATASSNVLKDIQNELWIIDKSNVKTLTEFHRPELDFIVLDDIWEKHTKVIEILSKIKNEWDSAGIIFTPNVNWKKWCYSLANQLANQLNTDVRRYSGECPNDWYPAYEPIMWTDEFSKYKNWVQDDFKKNNFSLLTATKAFGMWVNKKNIAYTIHYGIPTSMEALYQEWWRAGRDKKRFTENHTAECFVLLGRESSQESIEKVFNASTTYEEISKEVDSVGKNGKDIFTQLFLRKQWLDWINNTTERILKIYSILKGNDTKEQTITTIGSDTEKLLYRLMILWIINDYTMSPGSWWKKFEIIFNDISNDIIKSNLEKYINKYENDGFKKYTNVINNNEYSELEKYIRILLQWSYDHHAYSRRQSLKNLYENCLNVIWKWSEHISNQEFKKRLEAYFKFDDDTYIMQDIADNVEKNILKRIDVFYQRKDKKIDTNTIIDKQGQENLKSNLSRLLESYQSNVWLNLISGILRLFLNQYADSDGQNRFENALEQLKKKNKETQEIILKQILDIWIHLDDNQKNLLVESLLRFYWEKIIDIYNELHDNFSLNTYLTISNNRLLSSYKKLHDKFKTIR